MTLRVMDEQLYTAQRMVRPSTVHVYQSVCLSVSQSASQCVNRSASLSVSLSVSQSVSQPAVSIELVVFICLLSCFVCGQGLTSFYMMNTGEEGTQFGSVAGLDPEDMIYAQYREVGVFLWRGFTVDDCMDQCFSNRLEEGLGRQMPVHYGSSKFNIQFISSCLATQMPHGGCGFPH